MSIALIALFVGAAALQFRLTGGGAGHFNWFYHLLIVIFLMLNPVFALVGFASLAVPVELRATPAGQKVLAVVYALAFVVGWWLVAWFIDRVLAPKRRAA